MFTLNARGKWKRNPPIPQGYYGCGLVFPVAEIMVTDLCEKPLGYALDFMRKAKFAVTDEYIKSNVDMLASHRWPSLVIDRTYVVSVLTSIGDDKIDFGWGKHVGGGVPMAGDIMSKLLSYFIKCKNANAPMFDCVVVIVYLYIGFFTHVGMNFVSNKRTRVLTLGERKLHSIGLVHINLDQVAKNGNMKFDKD
uniref:Uncharacterized protein n=1 Tax=Oryza brachyantha TaxID=4533 RepID=J3N832_ORYBR